LLARLSGQSDIVVGIPSAGQSAAGAEDLVGHCVNFLPIRDRIDSGLTFAELLSRTRRTVLDAYEHQNYTYGTLVRKLGLPREPSHLPLVDVQFNLERIGTDLRFPGLQVEVTANPKSFVNFDLFMNVVESTDGLVIDCDYNRDLFDQTTVARWLGHFETLLESFASEPDLQIAQMPLLSEIEQRQLVVEWNQTARDYPVSALVQNLFERQTARQADATAAVHGDERLSYAQLDARANQLANHLRRCGAGEGDRVAIYLERSLELPVAILGILKAGCVYIPLDPIYPDERVQFILDEAEVRFMVTQSGLADAIPFYSGTRVMVDAKEAQLPVVTLSVQLADESPVAPTIKRLSSDIAYLIYTSGSTGKPKGVEITHRAFVNLLTSMGREPGLASSDVMLALTTISFDIAGLELMLPLAMGGIASTGLLVVDEEPSLAELLASVLRYEGWDIMTAGDGASAVQAARDFRPDAVVLDIMLPDFDGLEVLRRIRQEAPHVCVLFLTAKDAVDDRVAGITAGGDDYVTKPFSLEEVLARLRGLLRRAGLARSRGEVQLVVGDLTMDEDAREVRRGDEVIDLTATEFELLRFLMRNPRRVLSKAQILDRVWNYDFGGQAHVVELYISYLRKKIDANREPLIHTVRGVGYVLKPAS